MIHLLVIKHKPRCRHSFSLHWRRADENHVATLTDTGEYWFKSLKNHPDVEALVMTDVVTGEVKSWEK